MPKPPPFHPVLLLPPWAVVLDLSGAHPQPAPHPWSIGRYDELRPGLYTSALFQGARYLHVGVDLGGPTGAAVHAFAPGVVLHQGYLPAKGDYGHVVVTEHEVEGEGLWALHGHLSAASLALHKPGDRVRAGEVIGWLGAHGENGGWPPHVHFQLSVERPLSHDMPGAVDPADRERMLRLYPDPRRVLGALW